MINVFFLDSNQVYSRDWISKSHLLCLSFSSVLRFLIWYIFRFKKVCASLQSKDLKFVKIIYFKEIKYNET